MKPFPDVRHRIVAQHDHRLARRIGILNEPLETAQKSRQIGVVLLFLHVGPLPAFGTRLGYLVTRVPSDDTGMIVIAPNHLADPATGCCARIPRCT